LTSKLEHKLASGEASPDESRDSVLDSLPPRLVLYDGVCGLCSLSVRALVRLDVDRKLRYAPLQGKTAARLRLLYPSIPTKLDSFVYINETLVSLRSRAFVHMAKQFHYPWRAFSWLWVIPSPLADLFYRVIAKFRYRLWGKTEHCEIPSPRDRELFLP